MASGVAGRCESCGALLTTDARFCSSCGAAVGAALGGEQRPAGAQLDEPGEEHAVATPDDEKPPGG